MGNPVHSRPGSIASPAIACLTAPTAPDPSTRLPNRPTEPHRPGPRLSSPAYCPADPAPAPLPRTAIGAPNDNQRPPPAPFIGIERGPSRPTALTPCSNPKAAPHRWIRANGALRAGQEVVSLVPASGGCPDSSEEGPSLLRAPLSSHCLTYLCLGHLCSSLKYFTSSRELTPPPNSRAFLPPQVPHFR